MASSTAHFSAADFFSDCPWLKIPPHRKADILVEPLYPRLGLLGGAPESDGKMSGGKMSKLAALAAARRKKEGEKATPSPTSQAEAGSTETSSTDRTGTPLSLMERLSATSKQQKLAEGASGLRTLGKVPRTGTSAASKQPSADPGELPKRSNELQAEEQQAKESEAKEEPSYSNIRAAPSPFAAAIVGPTLATRTEPSHFHPQDLDLMEVYGQDLAEAFDFTGPSPDDIVLNAQSSAKGLAIRRKV